VTVKTPGVAKPDLARLRDEQLRREKLAHDLDDARVQLSAAVAGWQTDLAMPGEVRAAIDRARAAADVAAQREAIAAIAVATTKAERLRQARRDFEAERNKWRDATKLAQLADADAVAARGAEAGKRGDLDEAAQAYTDARDKYRGDTTAGELASAARDALANAERLAEQFVAQRDFTINAGVNRYQLAHTKIGAGKQAQAADRHAEAKAAFVEAADFLRNAIAEHDMARSKKQCIATTCEPEFQTCQREADRKRDKCAGVTFDKAYDHCIWLADFMDKSCRDHKQICVDFCH
jgi:hypothetical protein